MSLPVRHATGALRRAASLVALVAAAAPLAAQQYPTAWDPALLQRPDVKAALAHLEREFPTQVDEWIALARIQGKSEHEQERGRYVRAEMERLGLRVSVDSMGNVTGIRKGTGGGPTTVFAAHLDIVHGLDSDLTVHRDGDTLRAPGIFDNTASVANMLAAAFGGGSVTWVRPRLGPRGDGLPAQYAVSCSAGETWWSSRCRR